MFAEADRVYVIAEIGSNHGGSLDGALALIDDAAAAGADAVKFQMLRADTMYPAGERREITRAWELPEAWLPQLATRAAGRNVGFLCSAFDGETVAAVDPWVPAHKIASLELTWDSLLRNVAQRGKPMLVSTGAATLDQIRWALGIIRSVAPELEVVLMHCVCAYPAPLEESNLLAIISMSSKFRVQVGLSSHVMDPWDSCIEAAAAVALGAPVVEKHLRPATDRLPLAPDWGHALGPTDFARMVDVIRRTEVMLGDGTKRVMPSEEALRHLQRGPLGLRGA